MQGGFVGVDVYIFLIKTDGGYVLVDTGAPVEKSAELLLKGLEDTMKGGKLKLVLLTHGHPDHIGTLRRVVRAHPDVQVAFHEYEAPYILGEAFPFLACSHHTAAACKFGHTRMPQPLKPTGIQTDKVSSRQRHSQVGAAAASIPAFMIPPSIVEGDARLPGIVCRTEVLWEPASGLTGL